MNVNLSLRKWDFNSRLVQCLEYRQSPVKVIPLPQIADEAEKLDGLLLEVSQSLASAPDLSLTDSEGRSRAEEVQQRSHQAQELLSGIPNVMQLQDEGRYWRALAQEYASQRRSLTARAAAVEKQIGVGEAVGVGVAAFSAGAVAR